MTPQPRRSEERSKRVNEDDLRSWLRWAQNYEEIVGYTKLASSGRKWKITLPAPATGAPLHHVLGHRDTMIAPEELVLTSREALAFCMGAAAARAAESKTRKQQEWDW